MIYRIDDGMMVAEAFYVDGDARARAELLAFSRAHPRRSASRSWSARCCAAGGRWSCATP